MPSISVVICAFNEQENIAQAIEETAAMLQKIADRYEIICVNDGSTDGTGGIMRSFADRDPRIRLITHAAKEGIGTSLKDGYRIASCECVAWLPADGQNTPQDLKLFIEAIKDVDFVTAYYRQRPDSFFRLLMSRTVRVLLFILFGPIPRLQGTYMFRRTMLEKIDLVSSSFVLNFEFVIKGYWNGFRYKEVQTECLPRRAGESKVAQTRTIIRVFTELIKLRLKMKRPQR